MFNVVIGKNKHLKLQIVSIKQTKRLGIKR